MMLTIHTTESFPKGGNSVVHCQPLKNLTGSSFQGKKKVLRNVIIGLIVIAFGFIAISALL